jgi:hypothetical protein
VRGKEDQQQEDQQPTLVQVFMQVLMEAVFQACEIINTDDTRVNL